jgi:predicted ester cyclase
MTIPDPDLVDRLMAVWLDPPADDAAGVAAFRALYTDPIDVNGSAVTAADLLNRARALHRTYSDLHHELLDVVVAPGRLVVAFRMCGTHTGPLATPLGTVAPTGADVAIRTIDVLRVVGGRIAAVCVVGDELGTLVGLGALELHPDRMDRVARS